MTEDVYIEVLPRRAQRIAMWGVFGFAVVLMGGIAYVAAEYDDAIGTYLTAAIAVFLLAFGLFVGQFGSWRLVLAEGEFRYSSWLSNWTLPARAIVGYRDVSLYAEGAITERISRVRLEAEVDGERIRRRVSVNGEMVAYLRRRYPDLDDLERAAGHAHLLRDERLGNDAEERAATLARAGKVVGLATVIPLATFLLFAVVYLRGWVLHLAGLIGLGLVLYALLRFRGAAGFEWKGVRSGLLLPTALGAGAVFFGTLDYGQEAFLPFWREGLFVAAVGSALYWRFCANPVGMPVLQWVAAPLGFFLLTGGVGQALDGLIAVGEAEVLTVPIERLEVSSGSRHPDTYSLHFDNEEARRERDASALDDGGRTARASDPIVGSSERGLNPDTDVEIPLDYATYARLRAGQRIVVYQYTGLFGLRSYVAYDADGERLNGWGTLLSSLRWAFG